MKFTEVLLVNFIKKLIAFDKNCSSVIRLASQIVDERYEAEKAEWNNVKNDLEDKTKNYLDKTCEGISEYYDKIYEVLAHDVDEKNSIFERLQKCKEQKAIVVSAKNSIDDKEFCVLKDEKMVDTSKLSIEDIVQGKIDFVSKAYKINEEKNTKKKRKESTLFCELCVATEKLLNQEITSLRTKIIQNKDSLHVDYNNISNDFCERIETIWNSSECVYNDFERRFLEQRNASRNETVQEYKLNKEAVTEKLNFFTKEFVKQFPAQELVDEYMKLYALEPLFDEYECVTELPRNVHVSSLEYDITDLDLCDYTKEILNRYYYFMYRGNKISIPFCASFGSEFNYLFRFNGEGRSKVVNDACDLGMRLFMMIPPGKLNFTFVDPVTLGESFAMFTRLVDVDDRTSEIINGKIWSAPSDIEEKLKIMTDHISNVTQRCLQGKYDNIYEYNKVAEQNAEAYKVLMFMDFPAGLTEQSLKLLEQIVTSGPKCGVFTIIYRNESQYKKISERLYPLISNIELSLTKFDYSEDCENILYLEDKIKEKAMEWKKLTLPDKSKMNNIIAKLKKGIKNADKIVIGIEKVDNAETTFSTRDGIRVPIGIHGANEVQYLTLGVGGSHHALIAGVAGAGKSSLLHTIILRSLTQYSPEELTIYLVDFKRGVEFKIYADFELPAFRVVAIESEREFGYNILASIEREQKIRADIFKKNHVDKIEEYRDLNKKMPRILVIMDEFHELFANANDELAKKSAVIMERIVRQGRAFGVHLILASQSYSNINGLDRAVFDQMAVRIVLKCSKTDANLLLDNGSSEIDQISIDDPGRAVYNSEAGNKEYNSHFRVAYIEPNKHREMLQKISDSTRKYADSKYPTRILLSNIEDNNFSIFNQFTNLNGGGYNTPGRLYVGEPLSVTNEMSIELTRNEYSNLLMIGTDTEKARSMFAFGILSLCINYWIVNRKAPEIPFIILFNCKPLDDSYFKDTPKLLAELLPEYIKYMACGDESEVQSTVSNLYDLVSGKDEESNIDNYFFVFGYQRAEELKSEIKLTQSEDIDTLFNIMPSGINESRLSPKEMFSFVVKNGSQNGVHTLIWQDSFNALYQDDKDMMSYFSMKVAFDMSDDEFSRFVGANDVSLMSENNAIYYNRAKDNQKFRPYQAPDEEWLKDICSKLK